LEVKLLKFPTRFVDDSIQLVGSLKEFTEWRQQFYNGDVVALGTGKSGIAQAVFLLVRNQKITFFIEEKQ